MVIKKSLEKDSLWRYIDKDGQWVVPLKFLHANSFISYPGNKVKANVFVEGMPYFIDHPIL